MKRKWIKQLGFLIYPLLGGVFFLSALGKFMDIEGFKLNMKLYGFPEASVYVILIIEFLIAVCFSTIIFLEKTLKVTIVFLVLLTMVFLYGYFFLDIKSCGCFGMFEGLNPKGILSLLTKNVTLFLLMVGGYFLVKDSQLKINWPKRVISLICFLALCFTFFEYNSRYVEDYALNHLNKNIKEFNLPIKNVDLSKFNRVFVFSPSCSHCKKAIPKIILENKLDTINFIGVTSDSNIKKLEELKNSFNLNFPVLKLKEANFLNITKTVPVVFFTKNNIIIEVEKP